MGKLSTKVKNLLIPRKTQDPVEQPSYGTDARAIEAWAAQIGMYAGTIQEIVAGTNVTVTNGDGPVVTIAAAGSTFTPYASLTGAGELSTPGDLTQAGGFFVNDSASHNIILSSASKAQIQAGPTSGTHAAITVLPVSVDLNGGSVFVEADTITETVTGSGSTLQLEIAGATNPLLTIGVGGSGTATFLANHNAVGFFGAGPTFQQAGAGITTVAQLVTVLQNYGLLS